MTSFYKMNVLVICGSAFLTIFLAVIGLYYGLTKKKRNILKRLESVTGKSSSGRVMARKEKEQKRDLKALLGMAGGVFVRRGMTKQIEEQLARADIPLRGEEFLVIWMIAALGPVSLIYLLTRNMVLIIPVYILGIIIPPVLVSSAQGKKLNEFNAQICDALAIMSNALRAGFSFMQSMEMVGREMPDPIGREFTRTFREISFGTPAEEALQKMVKRVPSKDLDLLVTAVLIQRQVGGNLAEILDNISYTIRDRIRIQGEIKTLTAQGRISGLIISLIPPALVFLLLLINPGYMKPMFQSKFGWIMLGGGLMSELVGILLIKKIITIDI